jgi:hypothetical protein
MNAAGSSETFVPLSNYKASYPNIICGECAVMNILMKTSDFLITLHEILLGVLW